MTGSTVHEQLRAIGEIFAGYVAAAMLQAAWDYDDDMWFDCEEPFFEDEFDGDELDRRKNEVEARWESEFVRRSREAIAEALASEEVAELLRAMGGAGNDLDAEADSNPAFDEPVSSTAEAAKVATTGTGRGQDTGGGIAVHRNVVERQGA